VVASTIGVRITAGAIAFTVMPDVANSLPIDFTRPITPALVEE
jgi:hypothetical protein